MKLKELMPLLKVSSLHQNVYQCPIDINISGKTERLDLMSVAEFGKLQDCEVIGISTWLPFTIFLKGERR